MVFEIIISGLFLATLFNVVLNKLNMPTIIGYIFTGTILSYVFGLHESVASNENLKIIAEFGVVFLMFTIGLEFSVRHLMKMKKYVFGYGLMQFTFTGIIFYLIGFYLFGLDLIVSIIIALGLSLSSTAIVLKTLSESGEIKKPYGKKSVGILIFQDLAVIPILLFITIISIGTTNIGELLGLVFIKAIVLFVGMWLIGKYLLSHILEKVSNTKSNEIFIGFILFIIIGTSYLAHFLGFTYSLGAFIAGLLIAETYYKHKVEADLIPFRDLFLGFFFVTVGMQLKFDIIFQNINIILIILAIGLLVKILVIYFIIKFTNNKKVSLKTALTLFQFGEFGLVIFELAVSKNIINTQIGQILIIVIIISMIITPIILKNIDSIVDLFLGKHECKKINEKDDFEDHTILIGYGRLGKIISNILDKEKIKYIIVENLEKSFKEGQKDNKKIIFGNAFNENFLKSIKINKSKNIIISVGKNEKLYLIVDIIKKINPNSNVIVKTNFKEEKNLIKKLNVKDENIIVEAEKTAEVMIGLLR